jgi:ribosomal protein S18 acetylase RimI-like enzyme
MGAVVRPSRPDDRAAIAHALQLCAAFNAEEVAVALELFDEGVSNPASYTLFTAEEDGRVAGYVCLGRAPLTESTWYVYWLCVHPHLQGRGIGRALQQHGEAFVIGLGGRRMVLETSGRPDYHRARTFYQRLGYQQTGRIADFYRPGDDCLIYVKDIA